MQKKIAIIGAGFAGLATAWHLLNLHHEVTLYDGSGIGGQASGIAAGLLHPFVGAHAKYNWKGAEGMKATTQLLDVASNALSKPVAKRTGLLRIALTKKQEEDYAVCASRYPEVEWIKNAQERVSHVVPKPGILIKTAMTVNTRQYLQGLWQACERKGAKLEQRQISSLTELNSFDAIIVAMGAATTSLPELAHLPVRPLKGQILKLENMPPLNMPVSSQVYIVDNIVGATFERTFDTAEPTPDLAISEILPKATVLIPALKEAQVVDCRAAIRATTANRRPLVTQLNPKCWVFTGLGSKGLLYHALFAESLARSIQQ